MWDACTGIMNRLRWMRLLLMGRRCVLIMGCGAIIWKRGVNSRDVSGEQSQNEKLLFGKR